MLVCNAEDVDDEREDLRALFDDLASSLEEPKYIMMAGTSWSELQPKILTDIAEGLPFHEDLTAFRGVCRSWGSAVAARQLPSRLPSLLLAEREVEDEDEDYVREFFLLSSEEKNMINRVMLPEARKKRCLSSRGWLLTIETPDGYPHLLHPYSRRQFVLPNIDTFPGFEPICNDHLHYFDKFLLSSSDPSSPDFLVIVIWGGKGKVGFCRLGDASWTVFDEWRAAILDITYYNRLVYAIDTISCILVCDVHGEGPHRVQPVSSAVPRELRLFPAIDEHSYISRSSSAKDMDKKLLIVNKQWKFLSADCDSHEWEYCIEHNDECFAYKTMRFQVFEFTFDDNNGGGRWQRLDDLGGNRALFLGYNSTFVLEIGAKAHGYIKPDCIYYTDDNYCNYLQLSKGGGSDMGIYHMRDGSFETLFDLWESRSLLTPPTWIFDEPCL